MNKGGPSIILRIYFAVVSAVTLFTLMYGTIDLLAVGLKTYVFPAADVPTWTDPCVDVITPDTKENCEARNAAMLANYQREKADQAVRNLALMIVSLPLFIIHFRVVYRDWKAERNEK